MDTEILIIGGGMAGLVAGTVANEGGLKTLLLQKGQSATSYSSGAIDVIGYLPESIESFASPDEGLLATTGLYPLHPYSLLIHSASETDDVVDRVIEKVKSSTDWLRSHLDGSIASLYGDFSKTIHPLTIIGTTKPTCLVQETMKPPDFQDDDVLLFADVKGHPDFNATAAANAFIDLQERTGKPPFKVVDYTIELAPFGNQYNVASIELARHLDHDGSIDTLIESLRGIVETSGATKLALPPVLGIRKALENIQNIEKKIGIETFELLAFPPSIPGLRLQIALEEVYRNTGGHILIGHEAFDYTHDGPHIKSVLARSPRRKIEIHAKAVILASGKFISGGIQSKERGLEEPIFNLMTVDGSFHSASNIRPDRSTSIYPFPEEGHEVFNSGLSVDPKFRPIAEDGLHFADNLFCAGSLLAGYNYAAEKSGLGVALVTGMESAHHAAREVS